MQSIEEIRACFPGIASSRDALLDNAGGSQVPRHVIDAIRHYMSNTYVQLGADYETSRQSTATVQRAHEFINLLMNGTGLGRVVLASSTTVLCNMLADCYARAPRDGRDEIIVAETAHEANAGPWFRLADRGFRVHTWRFMGSECQLDMDDLKSRLSEHTRIVAFPHVSNILGRVEEVRHICDLAHEVGARVVVDGVAYAPHRAIDVAAWNADWYVYSTYKVFGPHMAALFGTDEAMAELEGPNHFFIARHETPYKFEPGGASHEGCAGLLGLWTYLAAVAGVSHSEPPHRDGIERGFARFGGLEGALASRILDYLRSRPDLRIIGPSQNSDDRVATISFVHNQRSSSEIVRAVNERRFGIRYGHFYAYRICDRLAREGVLHDVEDGVIRISPLHYNSPEEIDGAIQCLDETLGPM
ncbi:MAG: aminotransferase class V-fold PLP-dependent enzyme [Planctomycetota bacterium]